MLQILSTIIDEDLDGKQISGVLQPCNVCASFLTLRVEKTNYRSVCSCCCCSSDGLFVLGMGSLFKLVWGHGMSITSETASICSALAWHAQRTLENYHTWNLKRENLLWVYFAKLVGLALSLIMSRFFKNTVYMTHYAEISYYLITYKKKITFVYLLAHHLSQCCEKYSLVTFSAQLKSFGN